MPNLEQILGTYFAQYESALQSQRSSTQRGGHNHVEVRASSLVVHSRGHMGQFSGIAYVPALLPANLSVSELH
jgi:Pyruvate/2-oxoacid:ferredoxin oxidoreductase gamma subunit